MPSTITLTKSNLVKLVYDEKPSLKFIGKPKFSKSSPDVIYVLVLQESGFLKLYRKT